MGLTKIKTGGLTDNSVTDAKVADAITVTGAQTGITQVGTLTAGVVFAGHENPPDNSGKTEEYDGTDWSEQNDMNTGRRNPGGRRD